MPLWVTITIAIASCIAGSAGLTGLIQYLIARKDKKKDQLDEIKARLAGIEKRQRTEERDTCRNQMMMLMKLFPDDIPELLKVAQHYFVDLHGNWYMTTLFRKYLEKHEIDSPPDWFINVKTGDDK